MIYHHYSTIECVTMHWIYFSFVQISFFYFLIFFRYFHRKCSSTIQSDVYRLNNVSPILTSNNWIHKIYLYRLPLLYLLSKREPSDIKCVCVGYHVRYIFFLFLIDICSYLSPTKNPLFYVLHIVHITVDLSVHFFSFFHHRSHRDLFFYQYGVWIELFLLFLFFFVTRTYNVKNNEFVQRMITSNTFTEEIHTQIMIMIIL